jgi:hypothetical protein
MYYVSKKERSTTVYFLDTEKHSVEKWCWWIKPVNLYTVNREEERIPVCDWKRYYSKEQFDDWLQKTKNWVVRDPLDRFVPYDKDEGYWTVFDSNSQ